MLQDSEVESGEVLGLVLVSSKRFCNTALAGISGGWKDLCHSYRDVVLHGGAGKQGG